MMKSSTFDSTEAQRNNWQLLRGDQLRDCQLIAPMTHELAYRLGLAIFATDPDCQPLH